MSIQFERNSTNQTERETSYNYEGRMPSTIYQNLFRGNKLQRSVRHFYLTTNCNPRLVKSSMQLLASALSHVKSTGTYLGVIIHAVVYIDCNGVHLLLVEIGSWKSFHYFICQLTCQSQDRIRFLTYAVIKCQELYRMRKIDRIDPIDWLVIN